MKKVYLLLSVLFITGALKSQNECFDSLYRFSNNYGVERDLAAIDWNNDGLPDYAVANEDSNKVYIHLASPNHGVPSSVYAISLSGPFQVEAADMNGDANIDLIVLHHGVGYDDSVRVYLSNGSGGFSSVQYLDVPNVYQLRVDDIDNNSLPDILVFEYISAAMNSFYAYKNTGLGYSLYLTQPVPFSSIKDVALADVDGDGDRDIFIGSQEAVWNGSSFDDSSKVVVLKNTTTGVFSYTEIFRANMPFGLERLTAIAAGDFNGDGHSDFAVTLDLSNKLIVYMNNGSDTFFGQSQYNTGNYPVALATADLNGDSYLDLVYTLYYGGSDEVVFNNGFGGFGFPKTINSITYYTKLLLYDMDNDSKPDILHCSTINSSPSWEVRAAVIYNNTNTNIILTPLTPTTVCPGTTVQVKATFDNISFQNSASIDWMTGYSTNDTITYLINAFTPISISATSYNGCVINSFINISCNSAPTLNLGSDVTSCSPQFIAAVNEAGVIYNWTSIPAGFSATTPTINVNPSATTTYILDAINSFGCSAADTIVVNVPPGPTIVGAGTSLSVCVNTVINLGDYLYPTGGIAPYTYNWFSGISNYSTANPAHVAAQTQTFTLTITDANGCSSVAPMFTTANPLTYVLGHISTPSVPSVAAGSGFVYAFKYQPGGAGFDTMDIAGINASGDYYFYFLDSGQYMIKAILDTSIYQLSIPTYNGNTFQWDSSLVVNHTCAQNDTADIQVLEIDTQTGPGTISGYIIEQAGFGSGRFGNSGGGPIVPCVPGGPLKGIDVKLGKNPGGGIQARTTTDSTGYYEFENLPLRGYKIYVDIPNLPMDSTREIILDSTNNISTQNNYFADSASVYINPNTVVGIYASAKEYVNNFSIYPNPAKDELFVNFNMISDKASLQLTDLFGKIIFSENINAPKGTVVFPVSVSKLNIEAGVYFISVISDNQSFTQRLIVVK